MVGLDLSVMVVNLLSSLSLLFAFYVMVSRRSLFGEFEIGGMQTKAMTRVVSQSIERVRVGFGDARQTARFFGN
jgi:hypothetical protein